MDREQATVSEDTPLIGNWPGDIEYGSHNVDSEPEPEPEFDPQGDPENPREWPSTFKWAIVLLLACMAFTV